MATSAQVSSTEALERFHQCLGVYIAAARVTVEEVSADVFRTRQWVEHEQARHWEDELSRRGRRLEQARQDLFRERLSPKMGVPGFQQMQLRKAEESFREASEKLQVIRKWTRRFEDETTPILRGIEQLHGFLAADMVRARNSLGSMITTLEAYRDVVASGSRRESGVSNSPSGETPLEDGSAADAGSARTVQMQEGEA